MQGFFRYRYRVLLGLGVSLFGVALVGCSHNSGGDFANMSKDDQIKTMHNLPPEEVAIQQKMKANIMAAREAAASKAGTNQNVTPPNITPQSSGQH